MQVSFTPVMGQLLSYPPHMRQTFGGYLLLGVMPPKVRNYNAMYGAILSHIRSTGTSMDDFKQDYAEKVYPLCSFDAEDHALDPPRSVTKYLCLNNLLEDTRGVGNPTCSFQAPAVDGMCVHCNVKGVHRDKKTTYIGPVRFLGTRYVYNYTLLSV